MDNLTLLDDETLPTQKAQAANKSTRPTNLSLRSTPLTPEQQLEVSQEMASAYERGTLKFERPPIASVNGLTPEQQLEVNKEIVGTGGYGNKTISDLAVNPEALTVSSVGNLGKPAAINHGKPSQKYIDELTTGNRKVRLSNGDKLLCRGSANHKVAIEQYGSWENVPSDVKDNVNEQTVRDAGY